MISICKAGVDTTNVTFELANDIDMQGVAFRGIGTGGGSMYNVDESITFKGVFNGNEHVIFNLNITTTEDCVGLFGCVYGGDAIIDSIGLENCNIEGKDCVGSIIGYGVGVDIKNSYATGFVSGNMGVAGFMGGGDYSFISNSFSDCSVNGVYGIAGFLGTAGSVMVDNCYSNGDVSGGDFVAGFIGGTYGTVTNCYATGKVSGTSDLYGFIGVLESNYIDNCYFDTQKTCQNVGIGENKGGGNPIGVTTAELNQLIADGRLPLFTPFSGSGNTTGGNSGRTFTLQIGIDSTENSKISFDTALGFTLNIDVSTTTAAQNALDEIDAVLDMITAKQTELGAVQNRLDSVLDSLNVSIQNTTSSLSTIKDADIAKVSSEYIRAQILQQASSSLLATANQSPSIALNLI